MGYCSHMQPQIWLLLSVAVLEKILQETECWYWNTSIPRQLKAVLRMGEKAKTARLSYHKALKLQKPLHLISRTKENKTVTRASADVLIPRKVLVKSNSTMPQSCKQGQPAPPAHPEGNQPGTEQQAQGMRTPTGMAAAGETGALGLHSSPRHCTLVLCSLKL